MKKSKWGLIALCYIAFISLGLPDGLLGVAWPGIRSDFNQPLDALALVLIFSTAGYTLSSFFSGTLVRRLGLGGLLSLSCGMTASALLIYSITPYWILFVLSATLGGLGAGAIDAGINTYVAQNHDERMMQWLHASFGIGITLGPMIMTLGLALTNRWVWGYRAVALAQFILALLFLFTKSWWGKVILKEEEHEASEATMGQTLRIPSAWLSMLMFFIYTGVELGLGLWAYTFLTESRGISSTAAGLITGSYWGTFTLGRMTAGWYSSKIPMEKLITLSLGIAASGTILVILNISSFMTVAGIAIIGFAIAPIFPGLVSDTENRVGKAYEGHTIGMQIAAAGVGAAVVPSFAGFLARIMGLEIIPYYLLIALVLLLSSFKISHKLKKD